MTPVLYIRRAISYLLKLAILIIALYFLMYATGMARINAELMLNEMFYSINGKLLIGALVLLSALYPRFGYIKRTVMADITIDRELVINAFHADNYIMAEEKSNGGMTFRSGSILKRIWTAFDDKITVMPDGEGKITIEGMRKGVVYAQFRINTFINNRNNED